VKLQGYVASSATVTVKLTGTSTNATIYSDSAGTSKSNSFTAAADGFYFFYADNGSYDIVTTATTWTDIRVSEIGVTSNVMGFGAKCDGSTDDTAAIQRAIDVAAPNKVQLPTGTCKITDQLLISTERISIEGNGPVASVLLFAPTAHNKAAIKVDLPTANVISQTRLKSFSLHTADTTYLKIGIDIVDGSQTIVEDISIGTQGTWRGGSNLSPFTGTGSIGIRLQGRELGTFRNVSSCGAIPLYIADNPNSTLDLDHHKFEGFHTIAYGDNPNVYVESGVNLTNVVFEDNSWNLGGAGFYWPDSTSTLNSSDVTFRNVRPEQLTDGYMFYITKNSALRGLRFEDILGGLNANGVYLRGITQVVFDTFLYTGSSECINTDSAFDWRNSVCQTSTTANLGSLVEVWAEQWPSNPSPMPIFGRYEPAHSNHTGGQVHRFMGVYQYAKTGSLTNTSTQTIPVFGGSFTLGRIAIAFSGATKFGSFSVFVRPGGQAVLESTTDATITGVGNVANKITVDRTSGSNIVIRNNLGETVTYNYSYFFN
jgi:hypothetical protein